MCRLMSLSTLMYNYCAIHVPLPSHLLAKLSNPETELKFGDFLDRIRCEMKRGKYHFHCSHFGANQG